MDALSTASPYERVVLMKGAQTGGSEAGLNWLGYIIQNAPGIAMLVMPSLDMVRRNTTVRIDPLIEATPALRELVAAPRSRDAGNSLFRKSFPGGQLVMTGANSAVGLRSTPVRYLFLDEVDGYPGDADGEGDPVDLAIQRTATFRGRRKIYMVSTPTLKGHSRIEAAFLDGPDHLGAHPLARGAARPGASGLRGLRRRPPRAREAPPAGRGRMARDGRGRRPHRGLPPLRALFAMGDMGRDRRRARPRAQGSRAPAGLGQHKAG
jgi:hypothetical protein